MPGTAVFAGMLGVTFFGIFLTPVFLLRDSVGSTINPLPEAPD